MNNHWQMHFEQAMGEEFGEIIRPLAPLHDTSAHECCEPIWEVLGFYTTPRHLAALSDSKVDALCRACADYFEITGLTPEMIKEAVARTLGRWPPDSLDDEIAENLAEAEGKLSITLPDKHRHAILDPADPIHDATDFLVAYAEKGPLSLTGVNAAFHAPDNGDRWPDFLVAFASNGCGDYFAYDLRHQSPRIIYIEPDWTVAENLSHDDRLEYHTFGEWYDERIERLMAKRGNICP